MMYKATHTHTHTHNRKQQFCGYNVVTKSCELEGTQTHKNAEGGHKGSVRHKHTNRHQAPNFCYAIALMSVGFRDM